MVTSLRHEIPDRVPIDLGGFQTGIHVKAYRTLLDYLHLQEDIAILDPVQQLAKPSEKVLERFRVDTRYLCAHGPDSYQGIIERNTRNGKGWYDLKDEFGVVWSMPEENGLFMDISYHPLAHSSLQEIRDYPFPDGTDISRFTGVREAAMTLRRDTPYAISTGIGGVVYETCWYLRGLEQWFMDILENPALCETLLDKILNFWMDYYSGFMKEVGEQVDVVMIGDDLAGQQGPLIHPEFYRQMVKPRQKKLVEHIKSLTRAKIWYHTCGSCALFIPDLIDNGVDILNPVQTSAAAMDPRTLKNLYGDRLVFWGAGIDTQHVLPFAHPDLIRREVKKIMDILKPGGGFVFNNIHNIQAGVPPENIVALFDAAYEYGWYLKE